MKARIPKQSNGTQKVPNSLKDTHSYNTKVSQQIKGNNFPKNKGKQHYRKKV